VAGRPSTAVSSIVGSISRRWYERFVLNLVVEVTRRVIRMAIDSNARCRIVLKVLEIHRE
jgi:hypothetical protein